MGAAMTGVAAPTAAQFERIRRVVYDACGINLHSGKETLVQSRLGSRLRTLGLGGYEEYLARVETASSGELAVMLDVLTTNKTSFFRESRHFEYLAAVAPEMHARSASGLRVWSAGCSTGEEPYTLGMVLHESLGDAAVQQVRILATDLSSRVLAQARAAVYDERIVADVPAAQRARYFERMAGGSWKVSERVTKLVRLARLNLTSTWPMRGPFDVIFCRNVMIYFDRQTQERLIARYRELLAPGGLLFVGHSESLSGITHGLQYVQPAVYQR